MFHQLSKTRQHSDNYWTGNIIKNLSHPLLRKGIPDYVYGEGESLLHTTNATGNIMYTCKIICNDKMKQFWHFFVPKEFPILLFAVPNKTRTNVSWSKKFLELTYWNVVEIRALYDCIVTNFSIKPCSCM